MAEDVSIITIILLLVFAFIAVLNIYLKNFIGVFVAAVLHIALAVIDPTLSVIIYCLAGIEIIIGVILFFNRKRNTNKSI